MRRWQWVFVITVLTAGAAYMALPDHLHLNTYISPDPGDPVFTTWTMEHAVRTMFHHPTQIFDGRMYFPQANTVAWSDNLFIFAPFYAIFWLIGGKNSLFAYNMMSVFTYALAGVAAFILIKQLVKDWKAALIGAFIFNMSAVRTSSMAHLQLNGVAFLLFALAALIAYFEKRTRSYLVLFGLCITATFWSATYYFELALIIAPIFILWWLIFPSRDKLTKRTLIDFLWAGFACGITLIPTIIPYLKVQNHLHIVRANQDLTVMGWSGFFVAPHSWFYEQLHRGVWGEHNRQFPGLIALIFAAIAIAYVITTEVRRRKTNERRSSFSRYLIPFILGSIATVLLMQGGSRGLLSLPFRLMRKVIPGVESLRELTRMWVFPEFVICLAAAYGMTLVFKRFKPSLAAVFAVLLLIASSLELLTHGSGFPVYASKDARAVNRALSDLPEGAVAEYPVPNYPGIGITDVIRQLRSLDDNDPRYLGYTGYDPPELFQRINLISALPNPHAIAKMQQDGIKYILIYGGEDCSSRIGNDQMQTMKSQLSQISGVKLETAGTDLIVELPKALVSTPETTFPAPLNKDNCLKT